MRVSAKSDYALRALIELARGGDDVALSAKEIGERQKIKGGFLQAILADLRRADIVIAKRGQAGGWQLKKDAADTVTIADVIRAVDGPLVSVQGERPEQVEYDPSAEVLQHVWIAARYALREVFEHVTIRQLADDKLPKAVTQRTSDEDAWTSH